MRTAVKSSLFYTAQVIIVLVIGFASYWFITSFYIRNQGELAFESADKALNYASELVHRDGDLSVINNEMRSGEITLNGTSDIVFNVQRITGFGCTIFQDNVRISTTAAKKGTKKAAVGTHANEEITELVLNKGETFRGITTTIGKEWLIIYYPLKNINGDRIGMIAVFKEHDKFLDNLSDFKLIVALAISIFVLLVQLLIWLANRRKLKLVVARNEVRKNNKFLISQKEELEQLIFVVEQIEQTIAVIGKNDRIQWVNDSFQNTLQYSKEECIGHKVSSLVTGPETDVETIKQMYEMIFVHKKSMNTTLLQYRKDGSHYWARLYLTPLFDENNEIDKYVAISLDITLEKEAQDKLEESEANIRQIGETIDSIVYLYDVDLQKYIYVSPRCKSILGISQEAFYSEGTEHLDINISKEYIPLLSESQKKVEKGIPYDIEYQIKLENEEMHWIRERSFPIKNSYGEVIKTSGICSDITETKNILSRLNKNYENIQSLAKIGIEITEELSFLKIIENVHKRVNGIMDAPAFAIGLVDKEKNEIVFPKFFEGDQVFYNTKYNLDDNNILCNICIRRNETVLINDIDKDLSQYTDEGMKVTKGKSTESIIYMQLKSKGEIMGVITVQSFEKNAYTPDKVELLRNLSIFVSNALINAQLYESLEHKVQKRTAKVLQQKEQLEQNYKDTQLLSQIGLDISSSVKLDAIFQKLYTNVNFLVDAAAFGIRIYDADNQTVIYKYEIENGIKNPETTVSMADKNNYTVWCIENKEVLFINDNKKEYSNYVSEIKVPVGKMSNSLIFCPMIVDDHVLGVITVQSFELNAYKKRDLDVLKTLAFYTGIALSNAELYKTLETKVKERTKEVSQKNKEILDSINYAKHIQYATLTSEKDRKKLIPNSFVFYQPKDIVSGDFFRVDKVKTNEGKDLVAFVVADCTGHGVPGASLAILCSSIIKQSLTQHRIESPAEALEYAREQLFVFLQSSESTIHDGMDLAFCVLDRNTNNLYFSGAFSDCIIIRGDEEIILPGDRRHVGYQDNEEPFTNIEFQLEKGDFVYLTTDGYVDQFGGPKNRKFTKKRYLNFIHQIKHHDIEKQGELIKSNFAKWKDNNEQTDDVCVMGVEIT